MDKGVFSIKRLQITKANSTVITIIAIASFVITVSLVGSRALLSQRAYHQRVITEKEKAVKQLEENVKAAESLEQSYSNFINRPENIIKGNPSGTGERDGDNAKLVLDSLPSRYDFPALATSLEKLLTEKSYEIEGITGTDDEVNQLQNVNSPNPEAVEMPFIIKFSSSYGAVQDMLVTLERSIRPFQIKSIEFTGEDNELRAEIEANTFYQPARNLDITTKDVQ